MKSLSFFKYYLFIQIFFIISLFTFFSLYGVKTLSIFQLIFYLSTCLLSIYLLYKEEVKAKQGKKINLLSIVIVMLLSFNLISFILGSFCLYFGSKRNKMIILA